MTTRNTLAALLKDPAAQRSHTPPESRAGHRGDTSATRIQNIGDRTAEVMIYGTITPDPWFEDEVSAAGFVRQISELDVDTITVRINSGGGDVYDALAILNALRSHPAEITTVVEGMAASAASYIAQAGNKVIVRPNAEIMIHDASGICIGNAERMSQYAEWLDRISDNIASIYAERAGGDTATWRDLMRAETWFTAEEAVESGLADQVTDAATATATASTPVENHQRPAFRPAAQAPATAGQHRKETDTMDLRQMVAARLGIADDADDTTIVNALTEALTERADDNLSVSRITDLAKSHGLRVVDETKWDEMTNALIEFRESEAKRQATERAAVVDTAIERGKITAARRDHFIALMDADTEGTRNLLESLPDELAVPINELGHQSENPDDTSPDIFNTIYGTPAENDQ